MNSLPLLAANDDFGYWVLIAVCVLGAFLLCGIVASGCQMPSQGPARVGVD